MALVFEMEMSYFVRMVFSRKVLWATVGLGWSLAAAAALPESNPFQTIISRNPFGLKPPPAPPTNNPAATTEDFNNKVMITGMFRDRGVLKACLAVVSANKQNPSTLYAMLAVGEKEHNVEVLRIDDKTETVEVQNGWTKTTLNFKDNSFKPSGPAPGAPGARPPGAPPMAGMPNTAPGFAAAAPGFSTTPMAAPGFTPPTTAPRVPGITPAAPAAGNQFNPAVAGMQGNVAPIPGPVSMQMNANGQLQTTAIPTRSVRTAPVAEHQLSPGVDPAVQYINMATQPKVYVSPRSGRTIEMPPLPPIQGLNDQQPK